MCGCLFAPNPRVGSRQKTCGKVECQRTNKRAQQAAWTKRNPSYWHEIRLPEQSAARELASKSRLVRGPPDALREVPLGFVKDAFGIDALVFVAWMVRHQAKLRAEAIRYALNGVGTKFGGHASGDILEVLENTGGNSDLAEPPCASGDIL